MNKRQTLISASYRLLLCLMFVVVIWFPLLKKTVPAGREVELQEKRILAEKPRLHLSFSGLLAFPKEFDRYYKDNFGFRSSLVYGFSRLRNRIPGLTVGNKVLVGKNGWFFVKQYRTLDDYRGVLKLTPAELEKIKETLETRRDWLAGFGIKYLPVIAPAKWAIYPEHVPKALKRTSEHTLLDQALEYLEQNSDIEVLDLRKPLLDAKKKHQVYYKNDTHWNSIGMFVAAQNINKKLQAWFPEIGIDNLKHYRIVESRRCEGDLAKMMGLHGKIRQKTYALIGKDEDEIYFEYSGEQRSRGHILALGEEPDHKDRPKAVIFHDSFGKEIHRFLRHSFRRSVYFWKSFLDTNLIIKERPDTVIHILAQRHIFETLSMNPAGIVGDKTVLKGKTAQFHCPSDYRMRTFKAKAIKPVPEEQFLSLHLNGEKIAEWQIDGEERTFHIDSEEHIGMNSIIRYRFDYRYSPERVPDKKEGLSLPFDLNVESRREDCFVGINGGLLQHSKGYNAYHIDHKGLVTRAGAFDVLRSKNQSLDFVKFLSGAKKGKGYLLLVSAYRPIRKMNPEVIHTMESFGLKGFPKYQKPWNHIALIDLDHMRVIREQFGEKTQVLKWGDFDRKAGFQIRQIHFLSLFSLSR